MSNSILLNIQDLSVVYYTRLGELKAVDYVSLDIRRGEVLGLVGESGCGKSTLGRAILRMIEPPGKIIGGHLLFDGTDLVTLSPRQMRDLRGRRISMIFQDPMTSLNPVQRIMDHFVEAIKSHVRTVKRSKAEADTSALADRLGIMATRLRDHPHQFSGGMRQRVMIGLALSLNADLIIADEPTTSLDVLVEAQFLDLLKELQESYALTIMLITHNIGAVAQLADRVAVMYAGKLVELAPAGPLFTNPQHPYTIALLRSVPNIRLEQDNLEIMTGSPPDLINPPPGCSFHPRCPLVIGRCRDDEPPFVELRSGHWVACWVRMAEEGL
jgi:peptide/nickel transport system ATP-binding protein